jgi:phytoene dehydrogenase-like protein
MLASWVTHLGRTPDEIGSGIWVPLTAMALMGGGMPIASNLDPSRAPAGKAVMRIQVLELPCRPRGDAAGQIGVGDGTWNAALTERFAERVLSIVSRHIPNIPSAVIAHAVVTPDTIARYNSNSGPGDPYGGTHDMAQSYLFRPLPAQPSHQTEVPNLFMLGAATWPGHGINGGSGYIVANKLLSQDN